jgi:hypothetical protein
VVTVAVDLVDAGLMETLEHGQVAYLVGRHVHVGRAENERLVALVAPTVEQRRRLGVGARHDDARHAHDVELEARRVEPLDLLVRSDEHLAALVAALLGAGPLVLDVVAGDAGLDETTDQVAHVRIAAVAGIGVGDDERAVIVGGLLPALLLRHPRAQVLLVAIGGEQGAHDDRGLVRHLAQRVAREVGPGVLVDRALGRGRPAAEVDALDAQALHRHGLPGRVRTEGRDALFLLEQLAQSRVERLCRRARDGMVVVDGAPLLDDLARGVHARDALEARAVEPCLRFLDFPVECGHRASPARPCEAKSRLCVSRVPSARKASMYMPMRLFASVRSWLFRLRLSRSMYHGGLTSVVT